MVVGSLHKRLPLWAMVQGTSCECEHKVGYTAGASYLGYFGVFVSLCLSKPLIVIGQFHVCIIHLF